MAEQDKSSNSPTATCRVFISYSHDSTEHEQRVRALADQLRDDGIDARIDQYVQDPDEGWVKWMRTQVRRPRRLSWSLLKLISDDLRATKRRARVWAQLSRG